MTRTFARLQNIKTDEGPIISKNSCALIPLITIPINPKDRDSQATEARANRRGGFPYNLRLWMALTPTGAMTVTTWVGHGYTASICKIIDNDLIELLLP